MHRLLIEANDPGDVGWRAAFEPFGEEYCLAANYRRPVRFVEQNIRREFPEGCLDLILCRNVVFTYFAPSLQAVIARRLAERLTPGGFLVLGIHESLPELLPTLAQERTWLYFRTEE